METADPANPLLTPSRRPPFDLIAAAHAEPAIDRILAAAEHALTLLEAGAAPTWSGLMEPLYRLTEPLGYAWGLVHHYLGVMNSEAWRCAERALQPRVVAFSLRAGQSEPLYRAMLALQAGPEGAALSGPRRRVLASAIRSMRLSGVGLPAQKRRAFTAIQTELAQLSTRYSNNLLDATKAFGLLLTARAEIDGLPAALLSAAAESARSAGSPGATADNGPWRITLEASSYLPFMRFARRRDLREKLHRAYVTRASAGEHDNRPLVDRILALRREKAGLLGFATYAELSLASKMAGSVGAVDRLLDDLRLAALPAAHRDLADIQALAAATPGGGADGPLMPWDTTFWAERLREARFQFNSEDLRPYFPFPRVLDGLFSLARDLFGIRVEPADVSTPVWHPDVRVYRVQDADGRPLATFYLDPYSRPETKRGGAWMDPFAPRDRRPDGHLDLPVVFLVCNQMLPAGGRPALMNFDEVETLFHEFGHALQHMLTIVDDAEAAGIGNIEWDAVELASQFMENWCYHRETIGRLSAHVDTGAPVPDDLFDRLAASRVYRAGSAMLGQVLYARLDMELHHRFPAGGETLDEVKRRIAADTAVMPLLPEDQLLCGFAHIFAGGYAAGYYSYKWAEVLSADAFAAFEEAGLDRRASLQTVGRRYRDTILALGGGTHPLEVFKAFRGRDPSPAALLRHAGLPQPQNTGA